MQIKFAVVGDCGFQRQVLTEIDIFFVWGSSRYMYFLCVWKKKFTLYWRSWYKINYLIARLLFVYCSKLPIFSIRLWVISHSIYQQTIFCLYPIPNGGKFARVALITRKCLKRLVLWTKVCKCTFQMLLRVMGEGGATPDYPKSHEKPTNNAYRQHSSPNSSLIIENMIYAVEQKLITSGSIKS